MVYRRTYFLLAVLLLYHSAIEAQEGLGAALDNYTPVNGMLLNPSAIVDQRPWLDVHIAGVGIHGSGNLVYVMDSRLVEFSRLEGLDFYSGRKSSWAQMDTEILGPSASLSLGRQAFGVHTSVRYAGNARNIPVPYAQRFLERELTVTDGNFGLDKTRVKKLAWAEVGISYGRVLYQFNRHFFTGGATLNRLMGIQATSIFLKEGNLVLNGGEMEAVGVSGKYAHAGPKFTIGGGWGGSIGFTYKRMVNDASSYIPHSPNSFCRTLPYRFKIMASLIDLGYVRIRRNGFYNKMDSNGETEAFLDNVTAKRNRGEAPIARDGKKFTVTTPAAVNLQYEQNFNKGIFLNAFLLQRITPSPFYGPERANLLAVTPRLERSEYSISVPFSLVNYTKPNVGLAFRLAFFTLGTENIVPFLFRKDIYSADIYFHLRIRFLRPLGCLEKPAGEEEPFWLFNIFRKKDNDPTACPEW